MYINKRKMRFPFFPQRPRVYTGRCQGVTNQCFFFVARPLKLTNQITACADVIPRPGWRQVLLYFCTQTALQLTRIAQLVQV